MKMRRLFVPLLAVGLLLGGCKEKLNLQNIDTSMDVKMGLTVPIGTVHTTLGEIFTEYDVKGMHIGREGDQNLLFYTDTFEMKEEFHIVDMADHISQADKDLNIYDKVSELALPSTMYDGNTVIVPAGIDLPLNLDFVIGLKLDGINDSVGTERIDSVYIRRASFKSYLKKKGNLGLEWSMVDSIRMAMGGDANDHTFHCEGLDTVLVYSKSKEFPRKITDFEDTIPIDIDHFLMNLVKNSSQPIGFKNVNDSVTFHLLFHLNIPGGSTVNLGSNARINYLLKVQFIDYEAMWGFFKPTKDMHDKSVISIVDEWESWNTFGAKLPLADPKFTLDIKTQIAGPLRVSFDSIYSAEKGGQPVFALFDGKTQRVEQVADPGKPERHFVNPTGRANLNDTTRMTLHFSKDVKEGQLDRLFSIHPDTIAYAFSVDFDTLLQDNTPAQIRITPDEMMHVKGIVELPFMLNKGLFFSYKDTVFDLGLNEYSLDSIAHSVDFIDTIQTGHVKLFLSIRNEVPFDLVGKVYFLNESNQVVKDPMTKDTLWLTPDKKINIKAPRYGAGYKLIEAGENTIIADLNEKQWREVSNADRMIYDLRLDDKELQNTSYPYPVKLEKQQGLRIHIGAAATVDAILNFNNNNK